MDVSGSLGNGVQYLGGVHIDQLKTGTLFGNSIAFAGDINLNSLTAIEDVTATGAMTCATVNTGQGDNELYAMDQNVRTTDAVSFATVDTGQGANELYAMNQSLLTTDAVTFNTINTGQGANNIYVMNQDVTTTDAVTFATINTGQGDNNLLLMDQNLRTTDAVTFATINTGLGDHELYAMDQNVRVSDAVTFASVDTGLGANELYAMDQNVRTTDAVNFATVNTGVGDNELYAMDQNMRTTDDVVFDEARFDQANISSNPAYAGESSAVLAIESTTQGVLLPSMTEAQMAAISGPPTGLFACATDGGIYPAIYTSSNDWQQILYPSFKSYGRAYLTSSLSVTSSGTVFAPLAGSGGPVDNNKVSIGSSSIFLEQGSVYLFAVTILGQGASGNFNTTIELIEFSGSALIDDSTITKLGSSRTDFTAYPTLFCNCNSANRETVRVRLNHSGVNYSCNSNFSALFVYEL
jgi:hypothetical protein